MLLDLCNNVRVLTGGGIHRRNPKKDFDYGSEYRAKVYNYAPMLQSVVEMIVSPLQRARGDVKVKGQPDPYAYVPLLGQKLNHRKRAKLAGQFSAVLSKAKSGSAIGSRQRGRKRRDT